MSAIKMDHKHKTWAVTDAHQSHCYPPERQEKKGSEKNGSTQEQNFIQEDPLELVVLEPLISEDLWGQLLKVLEPSHIL